MDRFMLAENPRTNQGLAIIHMLEPIAIILLHKDSVSRAEYQRTYNYVNSEGVTERWTLSIHHYFTTDFNADNHSPKAMKILDKSWHWYKSYLAWEDGNIDLDEFSKQN